MFDHCKISNYRYLTYVIGLYMFCGFAALAQEQITVKVKTDHPDALYQTNEQATFTVRIEDAAHNEVTNGTVRIILSRDGGEQVENKTSDLQKQPAAATGTLKEPGFIRCAVEYDFQGKVYRGIAGAGFDPEKITPTASLPPDFDAFWSAARKEMEKAPMDMNLKPLLQYSNDKVDCFALDFATIDKSRLYGFLCVPKNKKAPFPAVVTVPSAGFGKPRQPDLTWANRGALVLDVGVHAIASGLSKSDYEEYGKKFPAYYVYGAPDREKYYFRRGILGVDRAITWLASRPDFDGRHLVVNGSSQGGGFSLIMAGMNTNVTAIAPSVPALCDHAGITVKRSAGWPGLCGHARDKEQQRAYFDMANYYDAVNFARKISPRVPVIMAVGFVDTTCCPSSVYSAFNVLRGAKRMFPGPAIGHGSVPEFEVFKQTWMKEQLGL